MKKILLSAIVIMAFGLVSAQQGQAHDHYPTAQGKWLIEANTGFGGAHKAETAFGFDSVDGETTWSLGAEVGYFIMDDLAVKVGLGYNDFGHSLNAFSYKIGVKYYILSQFPVQIDYSAASVKDSEDPSYVGLQAGYAWFVAPNISIEPGLKYNLSTDTDKFDNVFQIRIGFALHF